MPQVLLIISGLFLFMGCVFQDPKGMAETTNSTPYSSVPLLSQPHTTHCDRQFRIWKHSSKSDINFFSLLLSFLDKRSVLTTDHNTFRMWLFPFFKWELSPLLRHAPQCLFGVSEFQHHYCVASGLVWTNRRVPWIATLQRWNDQPGHCSYCITTCDTHDMMQGPLTTWQVDATGQLMTLSHYS